MLWHYVEHVPCTPGARAERAFGTRFARAAPETTRRAPGLATTAEPRHAHPSSLVRAKPPLATPAGQELAATAARQPCSSRRRQASPARQLAPRAVPARPLAPAVIPSHATLPCTLQRGGSPASSSTAAEPTSSCYKWRSPSSPEHTGNLRPPHWHSPSSHSTREVLLPHLRQLLPPPLPWPIRHL